MKCALALSLFKDYLVSCNYCKVTIEKYVAAVKDFLLFTAKEDVRQIEKDDILNYRSFIHSCGRYASRTQRGMISVARIFFKFLARHEAILFNPFDTLDLEMIKQSSQHATIDKEVMKAILDSISGMKYLELRDRALFELMYGTGLRVGEIIRLMLTEIDLQEGKIFVRQGKGRKDRVVPVGNKALACVKRYIEYGRNYLERIQSKELLFLSGRGKALSTNDVAKALKKRAKRLYPELRIYPHMLRHSFATHMLEGGAGIMHIKDILGHNSIETTVIYTHFNAVSLKKILKMYHPRENELYEEFERGKYLKYEKCN